MPTDESPSGRRGGREPPGAGYGLLVVAAAVVALAGYAGYALYPRFDLPAVEGAGLVALAAAAGIASFFSPCSFPLLVGMLGRQAARGGDPEPAPGRPRAGGARPLRFAWSFAAGAAAFMLLLGAALGAGGQALFAGVTFASAPGIVLRGVVGALLVYLGLVQLDRLPSPLGVVDRVRAPLIRRQAMLRRDRPVAGSALLGFGYVLAGFG